LRQQGLQGSLYGPAFVLTKQKRLSVGPTRVVRGWVGPGIMIRASRDIARGSGLHTREFHKRCQHACVTAIPPSPKSLFCFVRLFPPLWRKTYLHGHDKIRSPKTQRQEVSEVRTDRLQHATYHPRRRTLILCSLFSHVCTQIQGGPVGPRPSRKPGGA
ncbi:unnamed protein product, partial [Ectocarpus sp. 12 AP-2014]